MDKWLSMPEYKEHTKLSKNMVIILIEKGEIVAEKTEGGQLVLCQENGQIKQSFFSKLVLQN